MRGGTWILLGKELREIRRSRGLLASMCALPLSMLPLPLVLVSMVVHTKRAEAWEIARFYKVVPGNGDPRQELILFWVQLCAALFLVMPLFIPVLIAAQSVAGEKERRNIEPLLASPLTARQIIAAKSLAAVLPALAITWIAFALFAVGVDVLAYPLFERPILPEVHWLFAVFGLAPLLSFLGNTVTVLVSSRVSDARLAQQLSALVVIPFLSLVAVQFAGLLFLGPWFFLVLGLGVGVFDVLLFALAVRLFDRQRILSRWN